MTVGSGNDGVGVRPLAGRAWTRDDIPALWAAYAATGFSCALEAIRRLERQTEAAETSAPDAAAA